MLGEAEEEAGVGQDPQLPKVPTHLAVRLFQVRFLLAFADHSYNKRVYGLCFSCLFNSLLTKLVTPSTSSGSPASDVSSRASSPSAGGQGVHGSRRSGDGVSVGRGRGRGRGSIKSASDLSSSSSSSSLSVSPDRGAPEEVLEER